MPCGKGREVSADGSSIVSRESVFVASDYPDGAPTEFLVTTFDRGSAILSYEAQGMHSTMHAHVSDLRSIATMLNATADAYDAYQAEQAKAVQA